MRSIHLRSKDRSHSLVYQPLQITLSLCVCGFSPRSLKTIPCGETIYQVFCLLRFFSPPLSSCIAAVPHCTSIVVVFVVAPTTADRLFDCVCSRTLHPQRIVSRTHDLRSRVSDQLPSLSGKSIQTTGGSQRNWYTWSEPTEKTMQTKTASRLVTRPSV